MLSKDLTLLSVLNIFAEVMFPHYGDFLKIVELRFNLSKLLPRRLFLSVSLCQTHQILFFFLNSRMFMISLHTITFCFTMW